MDIETSHPFAEQLQTLLRDRKFKRLLVLWHFYELSLSETAVSQRTGIPISTISDIIKRWQESGTVDDEEGRGRKRLISKKDEEKVLSLQESDRRKSAAAIHKDMLDQGSQISYRQTLAIINANFKAVLAPYQIQISAQNRNKRVSWIEEHQSWRDTRWDEVVWTDEKAFALQPQGKKLKVKIMFDESREDFGVAKLIQGGEKVMFWGAISRLGKVYLDVLPSRVNAETYCNFLKAKALPAIKKVYPTGFLFQQDNAPPHRAKYTETFLKKNGVRVMDWPPQSPDLNPIEQVWQWMAIQVQYKSFENTGQLTDYVFELWEKLPENVILADIEKIKIKMLYVYKNAGELFHERL